ncbi:hypothetical protein ACWEOA_36665 [Streptomyces sp. NPDC004457]|uniref:hypothetical protein n=1 Tax=Streptomyces spinosus TaxID=2872623 RepID=UPI001CECF1B7|nr:hypothetical protein [Streptomyces spinosus]
MGDVFSANATAIHTWAGIMDEIAEITGHAVADFEAAARRCADWPGVDDSMAEQLRPQDAKERKGTVEAGTALMEAIGGMTRVLNLNGDIIQGAQNDAIEAIDDQASRSGRH